VVCVDAAAGLGIKGKIVLAPLLPAPVVASTACSFSSLFLLGWRIRLTARCEDMMTEAKVEAPNKILPSRYLICETGEIV
jgi:hypothetical protein